MDMMDNSAELPTYPHPGDDEDHVSPITHSLGLDVGVVLSWMRLFVRTSTRASPVPPAAVAPWVPTATPGPETVAPLVANFAAACANSMSSGVSPGANSSNRSGACGIGYPSGA